MDSLIFKDRSVDVGLVSGSPRGMKNLISWPHHLLFLWLTWNNHNLVVHISSPCNYSEILESMGPIFIKKILSQMVPFILVSSASALQPNLSWLLFMKFFLSFVYELVTLSFGLIVFLTVMTHVWFFDYVGPILMF